MIDRSKTKDNLVSIDFNIWCTQQQLADTWGCSVPYIAQLIRNEKIESLDLNEYIPRTILVKKNQEKPSKR